MIVDVEVEVTVAERYVEVLISPQGGLLGAEQYRVQVSRELWAQLFGMKA